MDRDHVPKLDPQVVPNNAVDASAPIIEIVVRQNDEHGILSFLAFDQDCIATKQLQSLHGVVGECDDRVVIVGGVGNAAENISQSDDERRLDRCRQDAYINELGFFFFLRIAVAVSFS